jgi:hypothetical protein
MFNLKSTRRRSGGRRVGKLEPSPANEEVDRDEDSIVIDDSGNWHRKLKGKEKKKTEEEGVVLGLFENFLEGALKSHLESIENLRKAAKPHGAASLKPPKEWWGRVTARIKEKNPDYSEERVSKIAGDLWYNEMSKKKRKTTRAAEGKKYGPAPTSKALPREEFIDIRKAAKVPESIHLHDEKHLDSMTPEQHLQHAAEYERIGGQAGMGQSRQSEVAGHSRHAHAIHAAIKTLRATGKPDLALVGHLGSALGSHLYGAQSSHERSLEKSEFVGGRAIKTRPPREGPNPEHFKDWTHKQHTERATQHGEAAEEHLSTWRGSQEGSPQRASIGERASDWASHHHKFKKFHTEQAASKQGGK